MVTFGIVNILYMAEAQRPMIKHCGAADFPG